VPTLTETAISSDDCRSNGKRFSNIEDLFPNATQEQWVGEQIKFSGNDGSLQAVPLDWTADQ
jgi:hypothetical protein